ncbi:PREDICTED: uncharacterized protein LOC107333148 isoform X2 [Acropora digitifera]|uniref:uncharacterized protein LOC107333148 isoform X2 n=1 Tax=Acropora digitifera TaxID=70779 RepID=UPI00077AEF20|nr:PREDICTED: uncharacterized protein LOC107333148 isoform X2 [Acropora digitifera]
MARIFRRAANKVINFRDGHESIGLLISDEKVVYESFQKVVMAQMDESISLLKWAKCEENQAIQDVFSKAFEVSSMWTSSWRDFNQEYYLYRKTFKEVLKEERVLDEARKRQAMHTTKLNRLQKQLEQSKRKSYTGKYSSLASEIAEVTLQVEKGQAELEVKTTKLEIVKAKKLRESMQQMSDGLNQWASKTMLVAEAYSKLANLIPDTPTQVSESKIFHGSCESRNIVNNLARGLLIDPKLLQQLENMSHSSLCNLYAVSTPILPAQQNVAQQNHVGLNSEKMPGKAKSKPAGHKGISPQALRQHGLKANKMGPNFGRPLSATDLRPPPTTPPPPLPMNALAHSTSNIPSRETNNNIGWYASANVSSNSDSDSEEGYTEPYTDPSLVQRKMVWKVLSDGAINKVGRVYEDKDVATCHYTEKQSEEDLPQDNESAVYVDCINDVVGATQTGKGVLSDGAINKVGRVYEDKDVATCHYTEKQSEEDLPQDNESAVYVDVIDDAERMKQPYIKLLQDNESAVYVDFIDDAERMKQPYEKLLQDNESAVYVDCINDVVSATQTGKGVLSGGAINTVGRVYEDKDVATCHYTEKQSEEDLPQDNESAVYVDVIDDAERMKQPYIKLLQDNESAVYVDFIDDAERMKQPYIKLLQDNESAVYVDFIDDAERMKQPYIKLLQDNESAVYVDFIDDAERMKQPYIKLLQDNESAVYVDFIDDAERMKQPYEKLLQDNESAVYVDCINDVVSATQTGKGVLQGGESALYVDLISDAESAMLSDEALPKVNESAARVS